MPVYPGAFVKQAKDLGLNNWPSRFWAINLAWTQIVALAANLLACYRHLALPAGELRDAAPKLLRYRLWQLPARLTRGQRKRWLHLRADWPWTTDVINTWQADQVDPRTDLTTTPPTPTIMKGPRPERGTRRTDATVGPRPYPRTGQP